MANQNRSVIRLVAAPSFCRRQVLWPVLIVLVVVVVAVVLSNSLSFLLCASRHHRGRWVGNNLGQVVVIAVAAAAATEDLIPFEARTAVAADAEDAKSDNSSDVDNASSSGADPRTHSAAPSDDDLQNHGFDSKSEKHLTNLDLNKDAQWIHLSQDDFQQLKKLDRDRKACIYLLNSATFLTAGMLGFSALTALLAHEVTRSSSISNGSTSRSKHAITASKALTFSLMLSLPVIWTAFAVKNKKRKTKLQLLKESYKERSKRAWRRISELKDAEDGMPMG